SRTSHPNSCSCACILREFCCPARFSFMPAALFRRCCIRGGCFSTLRWARSSTTCSSFSAAPSARDGLTYQLKFDWRNSEFREWVRLSIPLMLGVSLVSADDWILRYFASGGAGEITRLNYAKRLFALPISILGQAAGQASMPVFARLFGEGKRKEFADTVNQSVYRISAVSLLATAL